ncbi:MAG: GSCFA domain-containing protein [Porphyromonadaceae bacterium]|nr:GSCFA domain-containing protein [Porphyromonadaceae bacterium]
MTQLQTAVKLPHRSFDPLEYGQRVLSIGSCFSEHIGSMLRDSGHSIVVNPFGIQYNPISILRSLRRMLGERCYTSDELIEHDGLFHCFDHHGAYSSADAERALEAINRDYERGVQALPKTSYLLLTWGTAFVYSLKDSGRVVNNCHKLPDYYFERRLFSVGELVDPWQTFLGEFLAKFPRLQIITTISPVRHLRDGAHGNQLSKATLMLMNEELQRLFPDRIHYFPAYEIVQDELRDYRFYAEDMTHPSTQTARIIGERFAEWCCSPECLEAMTHLARLRNEYQHRPLHPDHPEAELRREQLLVRIRAFEHRFPEANLASWFFD